MFLRHLFSSRSRSINEKPDSHSRASGNQRYTAVPVEISCCHTQQRSTATTPSTSGPTSLVMVLGDKGVGKSTLTRKLNDFTHKAEGASCSLDATGDTHALRFVEWDPLTAQSVSRISQFQVQRDEEQKQKGKKMQMKDFMKKRSKPPRPCPRNDEKLLPAEILHREDDPLPPDCCAIRIFPQVQKEQVDTAVKCQPIPEPTATLAAPLTQPSLEAHRRRMNSRRPPPLLGIREISNLPRQEEQFVPVDSHTMSFAEKIAAPTPSPTPKPPVATHPTRLQVQAFILCYDIGSSESFFRLVSDHLLQVQKLSGLKGAKVFIVGTKKDTAHPRREVLPEQGLALAHSVGAFFLETSAVIETGCEELFTTLAFTDLDG